MVRVCKPVTIFSALPSATLFIPSGGWRSFFIADSEAVGGRNNLIIVVLKDKLEPHELTRESRTYMKTYTYIDVTRDTDLLMKKLSVSDGHNVSNR